jgi:anti-sigma factor RsiW
MMSNTIMTCPLQTDNADVLLDYCARSLDAERKSMLETHMESCAACREMASSQSQVWAAMDLYDAEPVSADFDRKLYTRIDEMERVPAWERFWAPVREYLEGQPAWKPVLSIAAACAVLLVVIAVRSDFAQPAIDPAAGIIDVREVEQAERALEDIEMLRQFDVSVSSDANEASAQKDVL